MTLKILFIEAVDTKNLYRFPGAGIGYLVTSLRREIGEDKLEIKMTPTDDNYVALIEEFQPDIVGITSMTTTFPWSQEAAQIAKERGAAVVVGGVHISLVPESINEHMDVGVLGEGEESIVDLVRLFLKEGRWTREKLADIPGIAYRGEAGELVQTPGRKLTRELDQVGFPAWDILPQSMEPYVLTGRGCPYKCSFCSSSHYWDKLRDHSPEHAVELIARTAEAHNYAHTWIMDDLFIAKRKRVEAIAQGIIDRGLHKKMSFTVVGARANLLDQSMIDTLKSMNVISMGFGLESGTEKHLRFLKDKIANLEQNIRAVELGRKNGMFIAGYLIVGSPGETLDEARTTLKFARDYLGPSFKLSLLTPLPGTPVWTMAKEKGLVHEQMNWGDLMANYQWNIDNAILVNEAMSRDDLKTIYGEFVSFQKKELARYFVRKAVDGPRKFIKDVVTSPVRNAREAYKFMTRRHQYY